jgi:vanillate O-demethylase ferredoxin subunit
LAIAHLTAMSPALNGSFEIVLSKTKKIIGGPAGKTMLSALLKKNVNVNYACFQGICGACVTRVSRWRSESPRRIFDR